MVTAPGGSGGEDEQGVALRRGPWTPDEDRKLVAYIERHGHGSWRALPKNAGLQRCGKSCRLRWTNYLRPDIKRGRFSEAEDHMIVHLHAILGNRWSTIAAHLHGRTDNEIKNYWNTHLKKRLLQLGIDPVTHKLCSSSSSNNNNSSTHDVDTVETMSCSPAHAAEMTKFSSLVSPTQSHMSQWDRVRLETEARLCSNSAPWPRPASAYDRKSEAEAFMSSWKAAQIADARQAQSSTPGLQLSEFSQSGHAFHQQAREPVPLWNAVVMNQEAESSSTSGSQDHPDYHCRHSPGAPSSSNPTSQAKLNPMSPTSILSEPPLQVNHDVLWDGKQEAASFWQAQMHLLVSQIPEATNDHRAPTLLETAYGRDNFYNLADFGTQWYSQQQQQIASRIQPRDHILTSGKGDKKPGRMLEQHVGLRLEKDHLEVQLKSN